MLGNLVHGIDSRNIQSYFRPRVFGVYNFADNTLSTCEPDPALKLNNLNRLGANSYAVVSAYCRTGNGGNVHHMHTHV